jgi:hypothetical protein
MTAINIGLFVFFLLSIIFFISRASRLRQQEGRLNAIGIELDQTLAILKKNGDDRNSKKFGGDWRSDLLVEPQMLATIITILVGKLGHVRLSLNDFTNLNDEDHVAVYIEVESKDLILALSSDPISSSSAMMVDLFAPETDDNTYH